MTTWNYRVTVTREPDGLGGTEEVFAIREVYYNEAGRPISWSEQAIAPVGDSWKSVADDLAKMGRAVGIPVLDLTGERPVDRPLVRRRRGLRRP